MLEGLSLKDYEENPLSFRFTKGTRRYPTNLKKIEDQNLRKEERDKRMEEKRREQNIARTDI